MFINRYTKIVLTIALAFAGRQFFGMATAPADPAARVFAKVGTSVWQLIETASYSDFKALLENPVLKPDINARDSGDNTPLLRAAFIYRLNVNNNALGIAKLLIEHGADVNVRNWLGNTPLITVCDSQHHFEEDEEDGGALFLDTVRLLIEHGADVNAQNNKGDTPLILTAQYKYKNNYLDIAKLLIGNGANVNAKGKYGMTPLMYAAGKGGNLEMVQLLVAHGADIDAKSKWGYTPLMCAAGYYNLIIVKLLIQHGANANVQDNDGGTPLMSAVCHNNLEMVQLLVEKGANVNTCNNKGETALDIAIKYHHDAIVAYLATAMAPRQTLFALLAGEEFFPQEDGCTSTSGRFPPEHVAVGGALREILKAALARK